MCKGILTQWPQCQLRCRQNHPYLALPFHIKSDRKIWCTWQIDYIGSLKTPNGYKYELTGVEVVSGLLVATKSRNAGAKATVLGLSNWFSSLPVPDSTHSDDGSHFTSVMVQDWAKREGY